MIVFFLLRQIQTRAERELSDHLVEQHASEVNILHELAVVDFIAIHPGVRRVEQERIGDVREILEDVHPRLLEGDDRK